MIGLDTSILVRYFAQDDPIQSPHATKVIEQRLTAANPGFISLVTIVETVWVLGRVYDLSERDITICLERILQADTFVVQNEQQVWSALIAARSGLGSFPDSLIGELGAWAGCDSTLTFDKKAARLPQFELA